MKARVAFRAVNVPSESTAPHAIVAELSASVVLVMEMVVPGEAAMAPPVRAPSVESVLLRIVTDPPA